MLTLRFSAADRLDGCPCSPSGSAAAVGLVELTAVTTVATPAPVLEVTGIVPSCVTIVCTQSPLSRTSTFTGTVPLQSSNVNTMPNRQRMRKLVQA